MTQLFFDHPVSGVVGGWIKTYVGLQAKAVEKDHPPKAHRCTAIGMHILCLGSDGQIRVLDR